VRTRTSAAVLCMTILAAAPVPPPTIADGTWGGDHVGATVSREGVHLEFDCAHGSIEGAVALDADGRFDASGVYVKEGPGPVRPETSAGRPARFTGRIDGDAMTLDVVLSGSDAKVGTFTLQKDRLPRIHKCA